MQVTCNHYVENYQQQIDHNNSFLNALSMYASILLFIFFPSYCLSDSVSTSTTDQKRVQMVSKRFLFMVQRIYAKQLCKGLRPSPSDGRISISHPLLVVISVKYFGFLYGSGLEISNFLYTPYPDFLSMLLIFLQQDSAEQSPTFTYHLQEPSCDSKARMTTLLSIYFSGLNYISPQDLHHPDYLSKYQLMTSSSKKQPLKPAARYSRYLIAYLCRMLMLRGVLRYLMTPLTFFFLKPHIFRIRRTTDLQILAFITGSIARRTSAIYTWVRKGFSASTSLSITILPYVFDLGGPSSEVFAGWIITFSFLARIEGSYFHYFRRMPLSLANRLSQFVVLSSSSQSSTNSFLSRYISYRMNVFRCSLNLLSLQYRFCWVYIFCQQTICFLFWSIQLMFMVFSLKSAAY